MQSLWRLIGLVGVLVAVCEASPVYLPWVWVTLSSLAPANSMSQSFVVGAQLTWLHLQEKASSQR